MSPWLTFLLLLIGWGSFGYRVYRRFRLLKAGAEGAVTERRAMGARLAKVLFEGFGQKKLYNYPRAGLAHHLIFLGFVILLPHTVVLWGRGFWPNCQLFGVPPNSNELWGLGNVYLLLREYAVLFVLGAVAYFAYLRVVRREKRLTLSREGTLILALIATMMLADLLYEASGHLLAERASPKTGLVVQGAWLLEAFRAPFVVAGKASWFHAPGAAALAWVLENVSSECLLLLGLLGYVTHVTVVLGFLNWLPSSKHFHILTALPNLFLSDLSSRGKVAPLARSPAELLERVEQAFTCERLDEVAIGYSRVEHFSFKSRLDWVTCTECGRCSEHCPATRTHKALDPKRLTLALRAALEREAPRLLALGHRPSRTADVDVEAVPLVPAVIAPEVFWACTTCRACEEQCPVSVGYVDTIVGLRRNAVLMQGEAPAELHRVFEGLEHQGNPWNFPREDRSAWARELSVPWLRDTENVEVLYWVGCLASYDERAKSVARAFVRLMRRAKIRFAILGTEEQCTGDAARRAGNELLFLQLAERNIERLNAYQAEGRFSLIVTTCPHCLMTLKYDYRALGGSYAVVSHVELLQQWLSEGRLQKPAPLGERVVYHDPCTLARGIGVVDAPRRLLVESLGCDLREPEHAGRHTLCCGAGGAQMWLEEQNRERINVHRSLELLKTEPSRIVSACPFCATMLADGCSQASQGVATLPRGSDLAELLEQALEAQDVTAADEQR